MNKRKSIKICLDLQEKIVILLVKIRYFCTQGKTSVHFSSEKAFLESLFTSYYRNKRLSNQSEEMELFMKLAIL